MKTAENKTRKTQKKNWEYRGHLFQKTQGHLYVTLEKRNDVAIALGGAEMDQKTLNSYGEQIASCVNACQGIENPSQKLPELIKFVQKVDQLLEESKDNLPAYVTSLKKDVETLLKGVSLSKD